MTLSDLISRLLDFLWQFWPLRIVHQWEQGLRLFNGRIHTRLGPGLHWFVPLCGDIITDDALTDVNTTDTQTCSTLDDFSVSFSLAVKYRISDMAALYRSIQDHDDTIVNAVCASAAGHVAQTVYEEVEADLADAVWRDVHEELGEWGVELIEVALFSFTQCRAFRLIGD